MLAGLQFDEPKDDVVAALAAVWRAVRDGHPHGILEASPGHCRADGEIAGRKRRFLKLRLLPAMGQRDLPRNSQLADPRP